MSDPAVQAPPRAQRAVNPLAAGFFVGYLVVQLLAPALQQFAFRRSGFAWKMYVSAADRPRAIRIEVLERSGGRRLLGDAELRRYLASPSRRYVPEVADRLPMHLCRLLPEIAAVRIVSTDRERTTPCAPG